MNTLQSIKLIVSIGLPLAAYLNIPYLLWVSFASVLNAAYYVLNRG